MPWRANLLPQQPTERSSGIVPCFTAAPSSTGWCSHGVRGGDSALSAVKGGQAAGLCLPQRLWVRRGPSRALSLSLKRAVSLSPSQPIALCLSLSRSLSRALACCCRSRPARGASPRRFAMSTTSVHSRSAPHVRRGGVLSYSRLPYHTTHPCLLQALQEACAQYAFEVECHVHRGSSLQHPR